MDSPEDHGSLDFDPDFAATLVGKYILVGVTVEDRSDTPRAARDTSSSRPGWSRSAPAGRTRSTGPSALRWCAPRSGSRTPGIGVNCPWLPAVASRTPVPECFSARTRSQAQLWKGTSGRRRCPVKPAPGLILGGTAHAFPQLFRLSTGQQNSTHGWLRINVNTCTGTRAPSCGLQTFEESQQIEGMDDRHLRERRRRRRCADRLSR